MRPPRHPLLPPFLEQSTSYYSAKDSRVEVLIYQAASKAATAEKAQQEPHDPWFLTALTAPLVLQSAEAERLSVESSSTFNSLVLSYGEVYIAANSAEVKSANLLMARV